MTTEGSACYPIYHPATGTVCNCGWNPATEVPWNPNGWRDHLKPALNYHIKLREDQGRTVNERELARLTDLLNDLQDARQAYDNLVVPDPNHRHMDKIMAAGDNLSNVAYELHNFLVLKLTRAGGL